jgi:fatty acyl-CoA reductase
VDVAAAVFDVDGTLCETRSTSSLVWHRRRQTPAWRHSLWLASLLWKAPAAWLADQVDRDLADRIVYREFLGLSEQRIRDDAVRCRDEILLPACYPQALAAIRDHRAAGRRIVLLSGGIDLVLQPLADALGADLVAQRLRSSRGLLTGEHLGYSILDGAAGPPPAAQGARKLAALRAYADLHHVDLARSFGYGDSVNDAPCLAAVGHPVAVNPDRRLARIARESGWEVRGWARGTTRGPKVG